jgi:hypothetical protein
MPDQREWECLPGCARPEKRLKPGAALPEKFKGRRTLALGGINFAGSPFIFAGYSGAPFSNRALNLAAAGGVIRKLGVGEITAHRLCHSLTNAAELVEQARGRGVTDFFCFRTNRVDPTRVLPAAI